jgi:hypothetical protein
MWPRSTRSCRLTSRVPARPSSPFPSRPAVSLEVIGTPVPSMTAYSLSGSGAWGGGTSVRPAISAARSRRAAAVAAPLASAARSTRLAVSVIPARSLQQARGPGERDGGRRGVGHRRQARRQRRAGHAQFGITRREAVPAGRAVIPRAGHGDSTQHSADELGTVRHEPGLMAVPAVHARAAVTRGRRPAASPAGSRRPAASRRGSPPLRRPARPRRSPATRRPARPGGLSRRTSRPRAPGMSFFGPRRGRVRSAHRTGLADLLADLQRSRAVRAVPRPCRARDARDALGCRLKNCTLVQ